MIKCHFHNCHFRNGVGCGNDIDPRNNRIVSCSLRELQCMMYTRMILAIAVVVHGPWPIIWMLSLLSFQ